MRGPQWLRAPEATGAPDDPARRSFVLRALAAIGTLIGAVLAVPLAGFGAGPALSARTPPRLLSQSVAPTLRTEGWVSVGPLADFEIGVPKRVVPVRRVVDGWATAEQPVAAYVLRRSGSEVVGFDTHCTHLGCPLAYVDGARRFLCPCHGGAFDQDGNVVAGPPPRPLWRYEAKVENGEVMLGRLEE